MEDSEKNLNEIIFKERMLNFRTTWLEKLFEKQFGFKPVNKIGYIGDSTKRYDALVKENLFQIKYNKYKNKLKLIIKDYF